LFVYDNPQKLSAQGFAESEINRGGSSIKNVIGEELIVNGIKGYKFSSTVSVYGISMDMDFIIFTNNSHSFYFGFLNPEKKNGLANEINLKIVDTFKFTK